MANAKSKWHKESLLLSSQPIKKHPVVRHLELGPPIHPWDFQTSQIRPQHQILPHLQQLVAATSVSATNRNSTTWGSTRFLNEYKVQIVKNDQHYPDESASVRHPYGRVVKLALQEYTLDMAARPRQEFSIPYQVWQHLGWWTWQRGYAKQCFSSLLDLYQQALPLRPLRSPALLTSVHRVWIQFSWPPRSAKSDTVCSRSLHNRK